jgi:hypothetical protein
VLNIKTLAMATAVSAGVVFAMPAVSQAMPQTAPVKVDTATNGNVVNVNHRKWHKQRWSWARYCRYNDDDPRCYRRHRHARNYLYYDYDDDPYYGYWRPRYRDYGPGIGLQFRID